MHGSVGEISRLQLVDYFNKVPGSCSHSTGTDCNLVVTMDFTEKLLYELISASQQDITLVLLLCFNLDPHMGNSPGETRKSDRTSLPNKLPRVVLVVKGGGLFGWGWGLGQAVEERDLLECPPITWGLN